MRSGEFLVIVDKEHKAVDVRFEGGDESVRSVDAALRSTKYPLDVPGDLRTRLIAGVKVACDAQMACAALVDYPGRVKLRK